MAVGGDGTNKISLPTSSSNQYTIKKKQKQKYLKPKPNVSGRKNSEILKIKDIKVKAGSMEVVTIGLL